MVKHCQLEVPESLIERLDAWNAAREHSLSRSELLELALEWFLLEQERLAQRQRDDTAGVCRTADGRWSFKVDLSSALYQQLDQASLPPYDEPLDTRASWFLSKLLSGTDSLALRHSSEQLCEQTWALRAQLQSVLKTLLVTTTNVSEERISRWLETSFSEVSPDNLREKVNR